jgi:16S rRNA (cytidine1402-2'-O)-methyltransferase
MPGISDPGNYLVTEAIHAGIQVIPIPGSSAVITALAASGLDTGSFMFIGFLPRKKQEQTYYLNELLGVKGTLVFYEAPNRVHSTLKNIRQIFGNRQVVLARELTKIHEEFIRGDLDTLIGQFSEQTIIGECTLLIAGSTEIIRQNSTNFDIDIALTEIKNEGSTLKNELKAIADKAGMPTKEVYRLYLAKRKR